MEPDCTQLSDSSNIKAAMACCHSLTYIEGEISGDPLDVKMYEATGWELEEVGEETNRYDIIIPTVVKPKVCLQIYMHIFFFVRRICNHRRPVLYNLLYLKQWIS